MTSAPVVPLLFPVWKSNFKHVKAPLRLQGRSIFIRSQIFSKNAK